jgi:hypothetical protein
MSTFTKSKSPLLSVRHLSPGFGGRRNSMNLSPQVKGGFFSSGLMSDSPIYSASSSLLPMPQLKLEDQDDSVTTCSTSSTASITSPLSSASSTGIIKLR